MPRGQHHYLLDLQRAQAREEQEQGDGERDIADARDDERFHRCPHIRRVGIPEADEQIAA